MDRFVVQAVPFSSVDSGCYDLVLVDIEGAEWNVLSTMKSRPKVLCLEMRAGEYKNPNTDKIDRWLEENHYQLWKHHNTDSIYI